jgi:hypothetical protein
MNSYPLVNIDPAPYADLRQASINYWLNLTGQENPPRASLRVIDGRRRLGRYVDPYCAQAQVQLAKHRWVRWYRGFLIGAGASLLFVEVDWVFILLMLPILAVTYLLVRSHYRRQYDGCYAVLQEAVYTGQPVWTPYDRELRGYLKAGAAHE